MEMTGHKGCAAGIRMALSASIVVLGLMLPAMPMLAQNNQSPAPTSGDSAPKPLPDIPGLMRAAEINQRRAEAIEKDYLYHSTQIMQQTDGHGGVKKTETEEYDIFWVSGVPVRRLVKKDGKELSGDELKKENERIDKVAAKARERRDKADAEGKASDARGNDEITVSRILELGSFTNPRRVNLNGRDAIAVDYVGDPKAKTRNRGEEVIRDMEGTVWVDEQDRIVTRLEGHFLNAFKIAGGLVASIQKGTSFSLQMTKVNDEVWLPELADGHGAMRLLLFFHFDGEGRIVNSDYRKFRTTSTILPGSHTQETPSPP